jgi:hypothetical protein
MWYLNYGWDRNAGNRVNIFWSYTDTGANRNNLAIVFRNTLQAYNLMFVQNPMGGRPAIGVRLNEARTGNTYDIFTFHCFSGGGNDAAGLLQGISATPNYWFAAGDFNRSPTNWYPPNPPAGGAICPCNAITYPSSGSMLDYAVNSWGNVFNGAVDQNFVVSDHYPVYYSF